MDFYFIFHTLFANVISIIKTLRFDSVDNSRVCFVTFSFYGGIFVVYYSLDIFRSYLFRVCVFNGTI